MRISLPLLCVIVFLITDSLQIRAMNSNSSVQEFDCCEIYLDTNDRIFYGTPRQIKNCNNIFILKEGKKIKASCPFVQVSTIIRVDSCRSWKRFPYPVGDSIDIYVDGLPLCLLSGKKKW